MHAGMHSIAYPAGAVGREGAREGDRESHTSWVEAYCRVVPQVVLGKFRRCVPVSAASVLNGMKSKSSKSSQVSAEQSRCMTMGMRTRLFRFQQDGGNSWAPGPKHLFGVP